MDRRDFMRQEFIGLEVEVVASGHPGYAMRGIVMDETKNTLLISDGTRERMVPKRGSEFEFTFESKRFRVLGSEIQHRPEDRIKKIR
jgi:ribonuclease P protein subunit POP4